MKQADSSSHNLANAMLAVRCNVKFKVKKNIFIKLLTDYYYNKCGAYNDADKKNKIEKYTVELDALKKSTAKKILKNQLLHYGYQGAYPDGFFEAADDVFDEREYWWNKCNCWVLKNYPKLQ